MFRRPPRFTLDRSSAASDVYKRQILWLVFKHAVLGFDIRATGANARAAIFAGVPAFRTNLMVALMSGALAGLAGAIEVAGRTSYVTMDLSLIHISEPTRPY